MVKPNVGFVASLLLAAFLQCQANTLIAQISKYPSSTCSFMPNGFVQVDFKSELEFKLQLHLSDMPNSDAGGVHIHVGTSCAKAEVVGAHYWTPSTASDPWVPVKWATDADGFTSSLPVILQNGYNFGATNSHAVVVHAPDGTRCGCGVLQPPTIHPTLSATIGPYPGYNSSTHHAPTGKVQVSFTEGDLNFVFGFELSSEYNGTTGGIHIHAGKTCSNAEDVGAHWWRPSGALDVWKGSWWHSDGSGKSVNLPMVINNGYDFSQNAGHAVVMHAPDGTRIGCGVLAEAPCSAPMPAPVPAPENPCDPVVERMPLVAKMGKYPGSSCGDTPKGFASAEIHQLQITFGWHLSGLSASAGKTGGIHIHAGLTCDTAEQVLGHYWTPATAPDQWSPVKWLADNDGWSTAAPGYYDETSLPVQLQNGFNYDQNNGHAVVWHNSAGTRCGCGVLAPAKVHPALEANIKKYPGYSGTVDVSGLVSVTMTEGSMEMKFDASGLKNLPAIESGGVHIHTGKACDDHASVGGHYWRPTAAPDVWNIVKWHSDANGDSSSQTLPVVLVNGYDYSENDQHAVVVHAPDGTRVGCGVLKPAGGTNPRLYDDMQEASTSTGRVTANSSTSRIVQLSLAGVASVSFVVFISVIVRQRKASMTPTIVQNAQDVFEPHEADEVDVLIEDA